jgi:integrase
VPAKQRGTVDRLPSGLWRLRYYDNAGKRHTAGTFETRTAAFDHYRNVIEPELEGRPAAAPDITFSELVYLYLERHALIRSHRTVRTIRARLKRPLDAYGETKLSELETMASDLAAWRSKLPPAFAYQVFSAMRQVFAAGIRWRYLQVNPAADAGPNPKPKPRTVRTFTFAELEALEAEIGPAYGPVVAFAAATGLRPSEWQRLERRDLHRSARKATIRGTKTAASRREIPLSSRALAALDRVPPRLDSVYVFPAPRGGPIDGNRWRRRVWAPAVRAAGITKPARIYDLRSTFASNALAGGMTVFELAKIMGTSVAMIEHHYGALIDGAHEGIVGRLDAIEATLDEAARAAVD